VSFGHRCIDKMKNEADISVPVMHDYNISNIAKHEAEVFYPSPVWWVGGKAEFCPRRSSE
jgi:hypothetical protein